MGAQLAKQLLLLVDGGNTAMKWQLFDAGFRLLESGYAGYESNAEQGLNALPWARITRVLFADVSGKLAGKLNACAVPDCSLTEQVSSARLLGVKNCYQEPQRLGVDRFLNAVQGYYLAQGAACVIDLGTATKVDTVNSQGQHQGGYIVPGVDMLHGALLSGTGKVRFGDSECTQAELKVGTSTASAVVNGCYGMTVQWLKMVVDDFYLAAPAGRVYLTGGFADSVSKALMAHSPGIEKVEGLVLSALLRIAKQTSG